MKHYSNERTLIILKPDSLQRALVGEIIGRFERVGLKIVGMKLMTPTEEMIEKFYTLDPEWRRVTGEKNIKAYQAKGLQHPISDPLKVTEMILSKLKKYLASGPVVAMVVEGPHAVAVVRKLIGSTEPLMSDVGTIRGDFVIDSYQYADMDNRSVRNLVHASGSLKEAENEIAHWFKKEEIIEYRLVQEQILYDVNIDGHRE